MDIKWQDKIFSRALNEDGSRTWEIPKSLSSTNTHLNTLTQHFKFSFK